MKTLIITGGTGNLGTAVVRHLSTDYTCVLIGLESGVDLSDEASVAAAVEKVAAEQGELWGLVHLVGGFAMGSVEESPAAVWSKMLTLNLMTTVNTVRAALPHLRRSRGRVVTVSAYASLSRPTGIAPYVVSKSAVNALVQTLAGELAGTGVTVNAVLPTTLDTAMNRATMDPSKLVPLERVAETLAFLLSEAGSHVNGSLIPLGT